jgi:hypothetical protein
MRTALLLAAACLCSAAAAAENPSQNGPQGAPALRGALQEREQPREQLDPRQNQRIERIHHEDAGSAIDELRVGGQTQQITVQPKTAKVPRYEVKRDGSRVWDVFSF